MLTRNVILLYKTADGRPTHFVVLTDSKRRAVVDPAPSKPEGAFLFRFLKFEIPAES